MSRHQLSEPARFAIAFAAMFAMFALWFGGQLMIRGIVNQQAIRRLLRDEGQLLEKLRNREGVHEVRVSESNDFPGHVDVCLDVADLIVFNAVEPELDQILRAQKVRFRTDFRIRSAELPSDQPGRLVGELGGMFFYCVLVLFFRSPCLS